MKKNFYIKNYVLLLLFIVANLYVTKAQQPANAYKKVVLQAFWWDYRNNNYPNSWANYLADLAPRLKTMGIDAVWIPGDVKQNNLFSNGYAPFDHYDLGDKLQTSIENGAVSVRTKMGTKDELLRMIAVMHANGIEVISDAVLNHVTGAGNAMNGSSGQDNNSTSMISNQGYKNFRYVSYDTPINFTLPSYSATDDYNQNDYWSRKGRWFKNYPNFHLHAGHWDTNSDMTQTTWGPDICYGWDGGSAGYGQSSNISGAGTYNATQGNTYMRDEATNWIRWYKKQTGVDGFRFDAVKHFSYTVQNDLLWNTMYNNYWNSGDNQQFNVGEYVGDIDGYAGTMSGLAGGELRMGTMDFKLRSFVNNGLYGIVSSGGSYDLGSIVNSQQSARFQDYSNPYGGKRVHRSCNFVNSHDTFRPILDANGNYVGWDNGQELYPGHIDPFDNRLSNAYAVCMALDGNIVVYMEDLFNLSNGKRYTHLPANAADLPARGDVENLIWCHRNLDFKGGEYRVRWQNSDYLVVERSNRALIGINDNWNTWKGEWVATDLPAGTVLKDYSGANGNATQTVQSGNCIGATQGNCVFINTPPVDPVLNPAGRRGYSVWAPQGQIGFTPGPANNITTQEWEMANDLGDSHCSSLGQGGALPANSTRTRIAGRIYVAANTTVTYSSNPEFSTYDTNIGLFDSNGNKLSSAFGVGALTSSYTPTTTGWITLKIWNSFNTNPGQKAFVRASYVAPSNFSSSTATAPNINVSIWTGNSPANNKDWFDCRNWEEGKIPNQNLDVIIPANAEPFPLGSLTGQNSITIKNLRIESGAQMPLISNFNVYVRGNITNLNTTTPTIIGGSVTMEGSANQKISGYNQFNNLTVNNASNIDLMGNTEILNSITLNNGKVFLGDFNLKILNSATVNNTSAARYFVTKNAQSNGGFLIKKVSANNSYVNFEVGTTSGLTNATLQQTTAGTDNYFKIRVFDNLYANGTQGAQVLTGLNVNKSWEIKPETSPYTVNTNIILVWNASDNGASFVQANGFMAKNENGVSTGWTQVSPTGSVNGSGPYSVQGNNITSFSTFSVAGTQGLLPLNWLSFEARANKNTANLTWNTANEKAVRDFEIQKSFDGSNFKTIETVKAKNQEKNTYIYVDRDFAKSAYYRIVQTDDDTRTSNSQVRYLAKSDKNTVFEISPNPAQNNIALSIPSNIESDKVVNVKIIAIDGKVIVNSNVQAADIQSVINKALVNMASGSYIVNFEYNEIKESLKLNKID